MIISSYPNGMPTQTRFFAGVPVSSTTLFHRMRFAVGDSAVLIEQQDDDKTRITAMVRDIEMDRARALNRFNNVTCAASFAPQGGLSGDRDTALAQGAAECLVQRGVNQVIADRTLPFIFAWHLEQRGIVIEYDANLGVLERRVKSDQEIEHLRKAQAMTEKVMQFACETIARATPDPDGVLLHEREPLTSQRVRRMISIFLMERGFSNLHDSIVATLPEVADCHHFGDGPLRTELPVIVDIFPRDDETRYWGDCTRTVVHGEPTDAVRHMQEAVVEAKAAATAALKPGTTGEAVHLATIDAITGAGYTMRQGDQASAPPLEEQKEDPPVMRHGTGHGIGLDVHEPILLDHGGGEILAGEVFTVEPGLYSRTHGGVRVEDMVAVTPDGPVNLNTLHEGLDWT